MNFFSYGTLNIFKKTEVRSARIERAVGQYVIEFDVWFSPQNPPKGALIIDDLHMSVAFGTTTNDLGIARPAPMGGAAGVLAIRRQEHGHADTSIKFRLYMMPSVLEEIEAVRNGSDATFHLKILGRLTGHDIDGDELPLMPQGIAWSGHVLLCSPPARVYTPATGCQDAALTIPESAWCEILARAGFTKTTLLEIPISDSDELGEAAAHVRNAQAAFSQGRYDDTVARCRDALDALVSRPDCPWQEAVNHESRKNMTVEDSFRLSWGAVRQITHATHHRNNLKSEFTRPMAQYVLGATSLALSLASKERDLFTVPQTAPP